MVLKLMLWSLKAETKNRKPSGWHFLDDKYWMAAEKKIGKESTYEFNVRDLLTRVKG